MRVRLLDLSRHRDMVSFCRFPHTLYRNEPCWRPSRRLARDSYLLAHALRSRFAKAALLAIEGDGDLLGRIALMRPHHGSRPARAGLFGRFDLIDDEQVATRLLDAALAWARMQGMTCLQGPHDPVPAPERGVLIHGFEFPASGDQAYNYPYYHKYLSQAGLGKEADELTGCIQPQQHMPTRIRRISLQLRHSAGYVVAAPGSRADLLDRASTLAYLLSRPPRPSDRIPHRPDSSRATLLGAIARAVPDLSRLVAHRGQLVAMIATRRLLPAFRRGPWLPPQTRSPRSTPAHCSARVLIHPDHNDEALAALLCFELSSLASAQRLTIEVVSVPELHPLRSSPHGACLRWTKRHRSYSRPL